MNGSGTKRISRRTFLPAAAAAAAPMVVPRHVLGAGQTAPSDKLVIAGVGVGAMGGVYLKSCQTENIAVLCDVDHEFAAKTFQEYPNAKLYKDYRVMLEKEKGIDAVVIGTPDHTHASVGLAAMALGKHVYCAKPMTRTIDEARAMARAAKKYKVATQMSTQSSMSDGSLTGIEWIEAGVVGPVREAHVWTDRPVWPQGLRRPPELPPVPKDLDWDLWLGPAPERPYHPIYHPFRWRGWVDFGTGAMGDMACHAFHTVFRALKLQHPTSVQAVSNFVMEPEYNTDNWMRSRKAKYPETFPASSIVTWDFPARGSLPPVRMFWYEGGMKPSRPPELEPEQPMANAGMMFVGDKGSLLCGFEGKPIVAPSNRHFTPPPKKYERTTGHYLEWINAAKGGKPASMEFDFASLITQTALMGVVAIRTGKYLMWDAENGRFTNDADANALIKEPARAGWA